jgi:hypothetical protein
MTYSVVMPPRDHRFYSTRPDILLRMEGLLALIISCIAYRNLYHGRWGFFALMFLVPDISLLGYLLSNPKMSAPKVSAAFYNAVHSYLLPLLLGLLAWERGWALAGQLALIWLSHVGFDRSIGYGLKFPGKFRYTHIQSSASAHEPLSVELV